MAHRNPSKFLTKVPKVDDYDLRREDDNLKIRATIETVINLSLVPYI